MSFARTVPIISYVAQRGACAKCGAGIDPLHLAGEIGGAMVLASAVFVGDPVRAVLTAFMGFLLLMSAVVDARTLRLPDPLTVACGVVALALALLRSPQDLLAGLVAGVAVFGVAYAMRRMSRGKAGEPGLGFGDVKLLSAVALWLGAATPWMVVLAAMGGLAAMALTRPKDGRLPFGPLIAAASWMIGLLVELRWLPATA